MMLSPFIGHRLTTFISSEQYTNIERLAGYIENGDVVSTIGRRYRLDEVPAAMRNLETDGSSGKSVIVIRDTGDEAVE
jgi:NADPH:quinone reductase-like Zn-dependent oxidoreductase